MPESNRILLRLPVVLQRTGLGRSSLYEAVSDGTFPAPVAIGARSVGWPSDAVQVWIDSRPQASRGGRPRTVAPKQAAHSEPKRRRSA